MIRWNSFLVLDFSLHVLNRIRGLHLQGDGLPSESLHEDLHPSAEPEDQVERTLLLDVVIRKGPPVLQLFASEDEPLLVRWDSLLVLDLGFNILDGVAGFYLQSDGLPSESLHEDLHPATEPEDQVESTLLLDVVVREGSTIFQLLPGKDQSLLVGWDSLLILDLGFDVLDR